jgi:hypothetical protein
VVAANFDHLPSSILFAAAIEQHIDSLEEEEEDIR